MLFRTGLAPLFFSPISTIFVILTKVRIQGTTTVLTESSVIERTLIFIWIPKHTTRVSPDYTLFSFLFKRKFTLISKNTFASSLFFRSIQDDKGGGFPFLLLCRLRMTKVGVGKWVPTFFLCHLYAFSFCVISTLSLSVSSSRRRGPIVGLLQWF